MANIKTFEFITPKGKNNRMEWNLQSMKAEKVLDIDVRTSRNPENPREYVLLTFPEKANVATMLEQLIADQEQSAVKFVTSKAGEPLEVDLSVKIGARDGRWYCVA